MNHTLINYVHIKIHLFNDKAKLKHFLEKIIGKIIGLCPEKLFSKNVLNWAKLSLQDLSYSAFTLASHSGQTRIKVKSVWPQ